MAQHSFFLRVQLPPAEARRTILINLFILFLLAATLSLVILYRQQVRAKEEFRLQQHYAISVSIAHLSESNLHLQQFLVRDWHGAVPELFSSDIDYLALRQTINTEIVNLQTAQATLMISASPVADLQRYITNWRQIDELLQSPSSEPLPPDRRAEAAGYLLEMERITARLLSHSQAITTEEQDLAVKDAIWYRYLFFVTALLFLLLVGWTLYCFAQFIDGHEAVAAELRSSERRHRALLDAIPDVVARRTRDGYYTDFKPARTFGGFMPAPDFIGKHVSEVLSPEAAQLSIDTAIAALDSGGEQIFEYRMPNRLTGAMTDYEARVMPCGDDEVQVVIRDITEEKLRVEREQQAQKLESLGMLAGGIAHDFNNMLTTIMAQISLANAKLLRGQQPLEQIEKALVAAQRAADLTRQLLAYAGKATLEVTAIDLNQLIRDNVGLLETALPDGAELRLALTNDLPSIKAERGHIQQVVMNIAINAAEALRHTLPGEQGLDPNTKPDCRHIAIETKTYDLLAGQKQHNILGNELLPGRYILLCIQDNGIGMEEGTIKRIFDPFFSTKEQGHGLGLSATLGIVRSYGGALWVESSRGVGTIFTLLFPIVEVADEQGVSTNAELTMPAALVSPKLLVIDDESSIREVVSDILQAKGFTIYQAATGEDGIAQVQEHHDEIDLVLLDMKMPGLSGDETLERLHQIQPSLKVVLSSGYTESDIGAKLVRNQAIDFLPKPYSQEQLLHTIQRALATAVA